MVESCASTKWSAIGDVTAYNSDGSILRQWNDVIIESGYKSSWDGDHTLSSAFKSFGFNFTDPKKQKNIIISNAVPCIIEYDHKYYTPQQTAVKEKEKEKEKEEKRKKKEEKEEYAIQNTPTVFYEEIQNLNKEQQREYIKSIITGINYDIKNASSGKDLTIVKGKIETLTKYNNSLPKKNFLIIDALNSIQYEYKQKAENLGIKL